MKIDKFFHVCKVTAAGDNDDEEGSVVYPVSAIR